MKRGAKRGGEFDCEEDQAQFHYIRDEDGMLIE